MWGPMGPMHGYQAAPPDWMGWGMWFAPFFMIAFWIVLIAAIVWLAVEVRRLRRTTTAGRP